MDGQHVATMRKAIADALNCADDWKAITKGIESILKTNARLSKTISSIRSERTKLEEENRRLRESLAISLGVDLIETETLEADAGIYAAELDPPDCESCGRIIYGGFPCGCGRNVSLQQ